jgi:hypothetical protein
MARRTFVDIRKMPDDNICPTKAHWYLPLNKFHYASGSTLVKCAARTSHLIGLWSWALVRWLAEMLPEVCKKARL